jgi:hypothetical protein
MKKTRFTEETLDGLEGVASAHYMKRYLTVALTGGSRLALVYVAANAEPGRPRPGYLQKIMRAARDLGFPPEYLAKLENLS